MKAVWIILFASILVCCSDKTLQTDDPDIQALRSLKESVNADSFLIILSETSGQHYIQFTVEDEGLVFDRPILAASAPGLPVVSARYYTPLANRPAITDASVERFLSAEETERAERYLKQWGLAVDPTYVGTKGDDGEVVEYFESFHGRFTVLEARFSEFLEGFFRDVFLIEPQKLKIVRKTENEA